MKDGNSRPAAARGLSVNRQRLKALVQQLGSIADALVFVGGSVAELLQADPLIPRARATKDVDAIVAVTSHAAYERLVSGLRAHGLREDTQGTHAHRWRADDGIILDLVPLGPGAPTGGSRWDEIALRTAEREGLDEGVSIRRVSAPVFLAMKWTAFADRGDDDWFMSHDVEDIIAVVAGRPSIVGELAATETIVREFVASHCARLLALDDADAVVEGALSGAPQLAHAVSVVRERFTTMAALSR